MVWAAAAAADITSAATVNASTLLKRLLILCLLVHPAFWAGASGVGPVSVWTAMKYIGLTARLLATDLVKRFPERIIGIMARKWLSSRFHAAGIEGSKRKIGQTL
jgi:hypothetical protein